MSINTDKDSDLALTESHLMSIRDAVKGSPFVKEKRTTYLKNPNQLTDDTYNAYIDRAEFDGFTNQTLTSMLGRMKINDMTADLGSIDYIVQDADGNGLSLEGSIECAAKNILQAKWQIAVVDYRGLTGVDVNSLSAQDLEDANARPVIKQYTRESVLKRYFSVVNGVKQLSFLMLHEQQEELNQFSFQKETVDTYLILALDEDGNYYQQKIIDGDNGQEVGEREIITINNEPLKFIPAVILSDTEVENELPLSFGFLSPISDICYYRYGISAEYKYYLSRLAPTINIMGMTEHDQEVFQSVNGRKFYAIGGVNQFGNPETNITIDGIEGKTQPYEKYMSDSEDKARSLGAVIPSDSTAKTATEVGINYAEQNAVLNPLVNNLESGYKWLISYCAMFDGVTSVDSVDDYVNDVDIDMARDFETVVLDPQVPAALSGLVMSGLETKRGAVETLIKLGWSQGDAETKVSELINEPPPITIV